ncbi:VOC family protein [Streptomyces millisiae]|uniref:VOC family protein n=1 Tax=Streptomyces millisiae TaxID=3075542 RepID=A0ABU2LJ24_9ACTN|nr:VOC family protein [Streptomyces sp. DSM 44918]MDT0317572.1 VOC family protein [Streptomyces sp. DSM 44918]
MDKITTCLWFDGQAEEAATFYTSVFPDSRVVDITRYTDAGPGEPGSVLTVAFELAGRSFVGLNGGPQFTFNEAISLQVDCADQAEVDELWATLTADGGEEGPCGWLKDKYGLSWQIVPRRATELFSSPDGAGAAAAMRAMMGMKKLDIAALEAAYEGRSAS